jgi:hypothetical protein
MSRSATFHHPEQAPARLRAPSLAQRICVDGQGVPVLTPLPLKLTLRGVVCRLPDPVATVHRHARRLAARPLTLALQRLGTA